MAKVERVEEKFVPVVITLESQYEVDLAKALFGSIRGSGKGHTILYEIFKMLKEHSDVKAYEYFRNDIELNSHTKSSKS